MSNDLLRQRMAAAWFAGIMTAYCLVILLSRMPPPFVDYPDWVYQGTLFHALLVGHPVIGYAVKHYPVPNSLTTVAIGLLETVMPWNWAAKVWVCCYLALASIASWSLAGSLRMRDWRLTLAMPAIVFLNLNFWYGHVSVEIGICLLLLLLVMLLRGASSPAVGLMLLLIFFTHMEACAAAFLLVFIWSWRSRESRLLWAAVPSVALTVWYAAARFASGNRDSLALAHVDHPYGSASFLVYKVGTYFKTFGYVNAISTTGLSMSEAIFGRTVFCVLIAASLLLAGLGLWAVVRGALRARGDLRIFVLTLLGLSLLLPDSWLGVSDPGTRLLLMALGVGLFLVDWRQPPGAAIAWLSVLLCVANLWQLAQVERNPAMPGHARDLPNAAITYGHVQPDTRLLYYDRLLRGELRGYIFATGLFVDDAK